MRFLIDMNLSPRWCGNLLAEGWDKAKVDLMNAFNELKSRVQALEAEISRLSLNNPPVGSIVGYLDRIPQDEALRHKWEARTGWMVCDGRGIAHQTEYEQLRQVLGADKLPDLRSRLLRGIDLQQGGQPAKMDPDGERTPGSPQACATALPKDPFLADAAGAINFKDVMTRPPLDDGKLARWPKDWTKSAGTTALADFRGNQLKQDAHTHSLSGGDTETRPVNVAVYWIIKATSRELNAESSPNQ